MTPFFELDLTTDEGIRRFPYKDSMDNWTIGKGHKLTKAEIANNLTQWQANGITDAEIETLFQADIAIATKLLDDNIFWWRNMTDPRQDVLVNMCFNMGWESTDGTHGLETFKNTLGSMKAGNYIDAAQRMLQSAWAREVGKRAQRLALEMRTGERAGTLIIAQPPTPTPVKEPTVVIPQKFSSMNPTPEVLQGIAVVGVVVIALYALYIKDLGMAGIALGGLLGLLNLPSAKDKT